jgi:hypothetical protein
LNRDLRFLFFASGARKCVKGGNDVSRKRSLWIGVVSALIAALLVYAVYEMQLSLLEERATVEVVVPTRFIDAGTIIEEGMVELRAIDAAAYREGMLNRVGDAVGLEAVIPLGAGEPILDWKLDRLRLMPGRNEYTFQIPKSYILSISSGIRAGDQVLVFASGGAYGSGLLFDRTVTVASVKSAAYTEVDDSEHSALLSKARNDQEHLYVARRDASAPIDHINLNLTEAQWLLLDRTCRDGETKLVIAFAGTHDWNSGEEDGS